MPVEGVQSPSDGRCGYTHEANAVTGLGGVCCWRPVWGDNDRCIWHADVSQKPTVELEQAAGEIGERLDGAIFRDMELSDSVWLAGRTITNARFVNCHLGDTDLEGTDLRYSHFEGVDAESVNLRDANLEHAEFHRTDLRDADLSGARLHYAVFDNARISEGTTFGDDVVYERELLETEEGGWLPSLWTRHSHGNPEERRDRYEAAHWTYDQLQRLAEDNGLPGPSREYYLKRKDVRRREAWEFESYPRALAKEAWRWTTGYGSNPWRVVGTSIAIIALAALLYPTMGAVIEPTSETTVYYRIKASQGLAFNVVVFLKSLYFSTVTFATLGYGDMQPLRGFARGLAGVEALLGQLLMALLVFVLTRRVTWSE